MFMFALLTDFILGSVLGVFFFGGLWLTVRRLEEFQHPVVVTLGSFIVRTAVVVGGFYLMLDRGWQGVAVGLLGFLIVRMILIRIWGPMPEPASAAESA